MPEFIKTALKLLAVILLASLVGVVSATVGWTEDATDTALMILVSYLLVCRIEGT